MMGFINGRHLLETIAIRKEDKLVMLGLIADFEHLTGKRQSFSKFQTHLLSEFIRLKKMEREKNANHGKDR